MKTTTLKSRLLIIALTLLSLWLIPIYTSQAVVQEEVGSQQSVVNKENLQDLKSSNESASPEQMLESQVIRVSGEDGEISSEMATQKEKGPEYVPGEIIVKLKDGKTLEDIKELNEKYKVTKTEKVFKDIPKPEDTLKELKSKLANLSSEHQSWYWQLDKNSQEYKDYIAKIEKEKETLEKQIKAQEELIAKLEERQKRAPEGVVAPNLENIFLLKTTPETDILAMVSDYKANPNVEYSQLDYIYRVQSFPETLPNDTYVDPDQNGTWSAGGWGQDYEDMWGLKKIQADKAWAISQGEGVIVAVIDTGVDYNHEDIQGNMWQDSQGNYGFDFANSKDANGDGDYDDLELGDIKDTDPIDDHGHGTHVAGTIAAVGNNNKGIIGVAPKAKIMALKGLGVGGGTIKDLASCIRYAADYGARVLNNSWGPRVRNPSDPTSELAIDYAYAKGCVIVFAAGNSNDNVRYYSPANYPKVITVAATDHNDKKSDFSNWGYKIDVSAPGGESRFKLANGTYDISKASIVSLRAKDTDMFKGYYDYIAGDAFYPVQRDPNAKYYRVLGTSMAAPHVAGLAALILAKHKDFTNEEIKSIIRALADKVENVDFGINTGYGRINAQRALQQDYAIQADISKVKIIEHTLYIEGSVGGERFREYIISWGKFEGVMFPTIYSSTPGLDGHFPIKNGVLGTLDTHSLGEGKYNVRLTVFYNDGTMHNVYSEPFIVDLRVHTGWPYSTGGEIVSSPIMVDLDHDGAKELIFTSSDGGTYVLDDKGRCKDGWPVFLEGRYLVTRSVVGYLSPAVADIDGDNNLDIIVRNSDFVCIFNKEGKALPGWPVKLFKNKNENLWWTTAAVSSPVVADLDDDGELETVISEDNTVHVFYRDGSYLPGWPQTLGLDNYLLFSTPAVGDIDKDGDLEIVIQGRAYGSDIAKLFVLHHDGKPYVSWPQDMACGGFASPILSDLDGDGYLEIISGEFYIDANKVYGRVYIWHKNGQMVNGWPQKLGENVLPAGFATADINKDGVLEIIVSTRDPSAQTSAYVFRRDGVLLWKAGGTDARIDASAPLVADIDGDNNLEIILTTGEFMGEQGEIAIFDSTGKEIEGLSRHLDEPLRATASIGDLDGDGKLELAAGSGKGRIFVWDMDGGENGVNMLWPLFQLNAQRTGAPLLVTKPRDTMPPTGIIRINAGAETTPIAFVKLNLEAQDNDSGMGEGPKMKFSHDNLTWSEPEAYAISKDWTLISGDGAKTVYVMFRDRAGNWSEIYSDSILLDTTPPAGAMTINSNALYTNSSSVTLTLSAIDAGSGMGQMCFSNDNTNWSIYEPYTTKKAWTLTSANGNKTVYVKFKDNAGNKRSASDSIFLDTTPPIPPVVSDSGVYTTNLYQLYVSWTSGSDPESGITGYSYYLRQDNSTTGIIISIGFTNSTSITLTGLTGLKPGKTYYWQVCAKNGAGLYSSFGYSDGITVAFIRGDVNADGKVDISDFIGLNDYLYKAIPIKCVTAGDVNDDGRVDVSDPPYLSKFLYSGGPAPKPPYPEPGIDPTP